ncbi:MAG: hypothetical protein DMG68_13200 [Acidobacteria bacterium]|nr:MAG: hypothetical protein DMG68_13200 [Acidobacteriota bacterium]
MNESRLSISQVFGFEAADRRRKSQRLEESVVELYAAMRPALVGYAYQVLGSSGDAEDLVQIAFLKLFNQFSRQAEIQNLRSWLYRLTRCAGRASMTRRSRNGWRGKNERGRADPQKTL